MGNRKYCLTCSPFKKHNTQKIVNGLKVGFDKSQSPEKQAIVCKFCNKTYFYKKSAGATLTACNSCTTSLRKFKQKKKLVDIKGGQCSLCGYNKSITVLEFHHVDSDKEFALSGNYCRAFSSLLKEAEKCQLVCANCHREIHGCSTEEKYFKLLDMTNGDVASENALCATTSTEEKKVNTLLRKACSCGRTKGINAKHCLSCHMNHRKLNRKFDIAPEKLKELVWTMPTMKIAELLNVSDSAITKRCKLFGIEKPPRGYWQQQQSK